MAVPVSTRSLRFQRCSFADLCSPGTTRPLCSRRRTSSALAWQLTRRMASLLVSRYRAPPGVCACRSLSAEWSSHYTASERAEHSEKSPPVHAGRKACGRPAPYSALLTPLWAQVNQEHAVSPDPKRDGKMYGYVCTIACQLGANGHALCPRGRRAGTHPVPSQVRFSRQRVHVTCARSIPPVRRRHAARPAPCLDAADGPVSAGPTPPWSSSPFPDTASPRRPPFRNGRPRRPSGPSNTTQDKRSNTLASHCPAPKHLAAGYPVPNPQSP